MSVRLATERDIPALIKLDDDSAAVDSIGKPFHVLRREGVLDFFIRENGLFIMEEGGCLAGYILTHLVKWMHGIETLAWIEHIGVHPAHRGRGIGLLLLQFAEEYYQGQAEALCAEIHPENQRSLSLFAKWQDGDYERRCVYKTIPSAGP